MNKAHTLHTLHTLKTELDYFEAVWEGRKTFEIRRDDRFFLVGDTVCLREWDPASKAYGPRLVHAVIVYVTRYNQPDGWVVFGFRERGRSGGAE